MDAKETHNVTLDLESINGWSLFEIKLSEDWVADLPAPTETYWFAGMQSFQGPVEIPISAKRKTR